MSLIVMKFGGTSVGDVERIKKAAEKVVSEIQQGHKVAVVVSAMAGVTDRLEGYCSTMASQTDYSEHDAVVSAGEQVTAGLMALALQRHGYKARSWQGWQLGLHTDAFYGKARIKDIQASALRQRLEWGEVAVVAGFQGVNEEDRITTLGRGGSDTSAVALAVALKADRCDIYTDVDGVFTTDPRIVPQATKMSRVSYEEMLELASLGAKVLQERSVEMAMRFRMPVQVLSTFEDAVGSALPGTLVTEGTLDMEDKVVTGIAYSRNEAQITLVRIADKPGVAAKIFAPLARAEINVDMIVQTASRDDGSTDLSFTIAREDHDRAFSVLEKEKGSIGYTKLLSLKNVAKISLVGIGMRSHAGVAAKMFETLAAKGINILVIETSEINTSVLIAEEYTELALRALHAAYGLGEEDAG
ncbi:MAG: aspartate kinase [Alphaproteobacteria bacterium]|nr:aspartate kinase [Alphaproteobacteria bacterium]